MNSDDTITIEDDGIGMSPEVVQGLFRIYSSNKQSTSFSGREVIGKYGTGFWILYAIANQVKVTTINNGTKTIIDINFEDGVDSATQAKYHTERDANQENGTRIELTSLKIETIDKNKVIENLTLFFKLALAAMSIVIDGTILSISESDLLEDFSETSKYTDLSKTCIETCVGDKEIQWRFRFTEKAIPNPELRGISVYSDKHLVQKPWFFDSRKCIENPNITHYIVGEVYANYLLDYPLRLERSGGDQLIDWSHEISAPLFSFIQEKINDFVIDNLEYYTNSKLKDLFSQYPHLQTKFDNFNDSQKESMLEAIRSIITAFELISQKPDEIILAIFNTIETFRQIDLKALSEWSNVPEENLNDMINNLITKIKAIGDLEKFVKEDARENPVIHNHIKENPWLLGFQYEKFDHELTRETFLKENFDIKVNDKKRIDTVAFENRGTLLIVELKRPRVKAGEKEFKQIADYVDFIRDHLGSSKKTGIYQVEGILVVGDVSSSKRNLQSKRNRLEKDRIYVVTWNDLISKAHQKLRKLTS